MQERKGEKGLATQMRVYRIEEGKIDEFLRGWLAGVYPLRLKHGFRIEGAWVNRSESRFVWLVSHEGPEGFEAADARYYASDARKGLSPDPAPLIKESKKFFVERVALPPRPE